MRIRVRTDRPRELGAALLEAGDAVGVRLDGDDGLELDTHGRARARARAGAGRARAAGAPLRGAPARRRPRGRLPLRGAAMSADRSTAAPRTFVSLALYRLLLRTQITLPRLLGIARARRARLLIGLFARWDDDPAQAAADTVAGYGLGVARPARNALARYLGPRRPRRGPAARVPQAEAGAALAASRRGGPRDGHDRRCRSPSLPARRSRRWSPEPARSLPRRSSPRRSRRSPIPACSSRPGSGSGAPSGGASASSSSGRTSSRTWPKARRGSPSPAGRVAILGLAPDVDVRLEPGPPRGRVRRARCDRRRGLARGDLALPARRRRLRPTRSTSRSRAHAT